MPDREEAASRWGTVRPAPLVVAPRPLESRWGFLCRLAEWNEYASVTDFVLAFGLDPNAVSAGRQDADLQVVTSLPASTWTDALPDVGDEFQLSGQRIRSLDYHRPYLKRRICPRCLADDYAAEELPKDQRPYLRYWWNISFIQTCPIHRVLLVNRCCCGRRLSPRASSRTRCRCGQDLTSLNCTEVGSESEAADRYLLGRIGAAEPISLPLADDLPPGQATVLMRLLGAVDRYGHSVPPHVGKMSDLEIAELNGRGELLLRGWPESFEFLLDDLVQDAPLQMGTAEEAYGYLHATLLLWMDQGQMAPASKKVAEVLVNHALLSVPFAPNARVLGLPTQGCRRLSIGLAASLLKKKNDKPFLRALNRRNMIKRMPSGMPYVTRIHLGSYYSNPPLLTAKEATTLLGVSDVTIVKLAASGLVGDQAPGERRSCVPRYIKKDIDALIRKTWPRNVVDEPGQLVGIRRVGYIGRIKTPQILEAMLTGQLRASATLREIWGIEGLLFDPEHVWEVLRGGRAAQAERTRRLLHEAYVRRRDAQKQKGT